MVEFQAQWQLVAARLSFHPFTLHAKPVAVRGIQLSENLRSFTWTCGDACVSDRQRLISPKVAFMDYTKSNFSRLNTAKMKTSGSPGNPWTDYLFTVQPQQEGGTVWGWEEGQERLNGGVYVQGLKEITSGKAASPCWPLPQQQISQSEQHLHVVFTSDEVS